MGCDGRLNVWLTWFESSSPDGVDDLRLGQWRANYDEACAIAKYFRWMVGRSRAPSARGES